MDLILSLKTQVYKMCPRELPREIMAQAFCFSYTVFDRNKDIHK